MTTLAENTARDRWLSERRGGIGASESAAVLGISPFKSAFELWCEKTEAIAPEDLSDNEAVEFGLRCEPMLCEAFRDRTGREVNTWPQYEVERHPEFPWLRCTPDATQIALPEERSAFPWMENRGTLQIKTTSAWNQKDWAEGPPLSYQVQCQHELAVLGYEWGTLLVWIGGQKLRWFDFQRNQPFIDALIPQLREFWARVENGDPPPPDGSAGTARALAKLYPGDGSGECALPPEAAEWDAELTIAKEQIKALKKTEDALKNKFAAAIGEHSLGILTDGSAYSYKLTERKGFTVAPTSFKTLRKVGQ